MAKQRYIDTHFWDDAYIEQLRPIERYLFMYFLTNPHTNICGVYELSKKKIASEASLSRVQIDKILQKFSDGGKIYYIDGWVYIKNFIRHQSVNPKILLGIENKLKELPLEITRKIKELSPIHSLSIETQLPESESNLKLKSNSLREGGDSFEKFWDAFPKKIAKKQAEKAFKKISPAELPAILQDILRRKKTEDWQKKDGQFIPYPATYLNNERWKDELIIPKADPPRNCKICGRPTKDWIQSGSGVVCHDCNSSPPRAEGKKKLQEMKAGVIKTIN